MNDMNDKKFELPTQEDSWAKVELWRWQYGTLPQPDDMRPLDVSAGLRGIAAAIRNGDRSNFPTPFNVIAVLEYAAKVISANVARVSSGAAADRLRSDDAQSAQPALLDGAAPDGNAGPRPRHTGRAQRPASASGEAQPIRRTQEGK